MTLSQFATGLSKAAVYVRHANAVKRGRVLERAVNYGWRYLLNRALRKWSL